MKDLILVTAYCDTPAKYDVLRNLVNQINQQSDYFDLFLVSHSPIPQDISEKTDLTLFDKKNELIHDWTLRAKPWFNPGDERPIMSIFTGFFGTHLAIWRMLILGLSVSKNCGYKKVHHLEYDCDIKDFSEFKKNSQILDNNNAVVYNKIVGTVDPIIFGTFQSFRLDTIHEDLIVLDEEKIKKTIFDSPDKNAERMLYDLLNHNGKTIVKNKNVLDENGNRFGMSHNKLASGNTAWCLPYYDNLSEKLGFVIWNMEENAEDIEVKIIYNDSEVINFGRVKPQHWMLRDIDDYRNAKSLTVIHNNKIRNVFEFDKYREEFKAASFRQENRRL